MPGPAGPAAAAAGGVLRSAANRRPRREAPRRAGTWQPAGAEPPLNCLCWCGAIIMTGPEGGVHCREAEVAGADGGVYLRPGRRGIGEEEDLEKSCRR